MSTPYSISNYIGQTVRRMTVCVRGKDRRYRHLFSIVEAVMPWMADYARYDTDDGQPWLVRVDGADGESDKVYLAIDKVVLTEEMVNEPWANWLIGKDVIEFGGKGYEFMDGSPDKYKLVPASESEKDEWRSALPKRKTALYAALCLPKEKPEIASKALADDSLNDQLTELSTKWLGYDLSLNSNLLGGIFFVTYNPWYHSLAFRKDGEAPGIFLRIEKPQFKNEILRFEIDGFYKDEQIFKRSFQTNPRQSLYHFNLNDRFNRLSIAVLDKEGHLVDLYRDLAFIETIIVDTMMGSKKVVAKTAAGKEVKFDKFSSDPPMVLGKAEKNTDKPKESPEFSYAALEKNLTMVFFEGGKQQNEIEKSFKKAEKCIGRILDKARKICYICDVYFDPEAFTRYIWPIKSLDVEIRILSSSKFHQSKDGEKELMLNLIREYNEKIGGNVKCRLFKGDSPILHDRFIAADDKVWLLGCSLNMFGKRATTLVRVPEKYQSRLIAQAEDWWNDDNATKDLV